MAVFQQERLRGRHVAAIRESGIQRIELVMAPRTFDFQNRQQVKEILTECRKQGVSVVSVHGNLQHKYDDPVEETRRAAAAALLDETGFAEEAGAGILVAHIGTNDAARRTVTELLDQTADLRIRLTVENMRGGLKPYADFVDRIGSDRFGLTVDIGHARDPDGINPFVKPGRSVDELAVGGRRVSGTCTDPRFRQLVLHWNGLGQPRRNSDPSLARGLRFSMRMILVLGLPVRLVFIHVADGRAELIAGSAPPIRSNRMVS